MSRSSAGGTRKAAGAGGAPVLGKLGELPLLRTKHIDTLEVLETYSQDMNKLQKENKALQQQLAKMSALSGDPYAHIASLENLLGVERDSNAELNSRISVLTIEADRHRSESSTLRDAQSQINSLRSELHVLTQTHQGCIASRQALSETIASLTGTNKDLSSSAQTTQSQVEEYRNQLEKQSERLSQLEIQAALGPPLPIANGAAAAASGTAASSDEAQTARALKARNARTKEKLREKETLLARQLEDTEHLRAQLQSVTSSAAEQAQSYKSLLDQNKKLQAELATSHSAASTARKQVQAREEYSKREREWAAEKKGLLAQLEAAQKAAAAAAAAAGPVQQQPHAPRGPSKTDSELREQVTHLSSEVQTLRQQLDHLHAQNGLLRTEHSKVAAAFNKVLQQGGGVGAGGLGVGTSGGGGAGAANTITIASKKGMFPEFLAVKRENESLQTQVADLQHTIRLMQARMGGAGAASGQAAPSTGASATASRPAARSSGPLGSSKSLALIAAHENSIGAASASPSASPGGSPTASTASLATALRGSPLAGRRSSGGWPAAAVQSSKQSAKR